jgi:hypothetical protein
VRVSFVSSPIRETVAPAIAPPEISVTVPVMPPRVCWACAEGAARNVRQQQREEVRMKTENVVLLLLAIRDGLLNLSRYTWPIKSSQDSLGTAVYASEVSGLAKPCGQDVKYWEQPIPILLGTVTKNLI